jgi:hypothetical protein
MRFAPCRVFEHASTPTPTDFATTVLGNGGYRASVGAVRRACKAHQWRCEVRDCSADGNRAAIEELP